MTDEIITIGNSSIQHGKHSNRAYLMNLAPGDLPTVMSYLDDLARTEGYTKIFAKVPAKAKKDFMANSYLSEATIPGFYQGERDVCFMGKYFDSERKEEQNPDLVQAALDAAQGKEPLLEVPPLEAPLQCRLARTEDAEAMAQLYRQVFATYPFPIHDPGYLQETMASHVDYFGIWNGDELIALASAEKDLSGENAEMTDFATDPAFRSRGLANYLLARLEESAGRQGIRTAFTIARAYSYGMNITFAKSSYTYSGTLTHNTQISGKLESMNVWYKDLQA